MDKPVFVKTSEGYINLTMARWIEEDNKNAVRI